MANSFVYQDKKFSVGDTLSFTYAIKEGDKIRKQVFKGILIKIHGNTPITRTITIRKVSKSGIGVERIIPLASPLLSTIRLIKKGKAQRAKLYYIRNLSGQQLSQKLYQKK